MKSKPLTVSDMSKSLRSDAVHFCESKNLVLGFLEPCEMKNLTCLWCSDRCSVLSAEILFWAVCKISRKPENAQIVSRFQRVIVNTSCHKSAKDSSDIAQPAPLPRYAREPDSESQPRQPDLCTASSTASFQQTRSHELTRWRMRYWGITCFDVRGKALRREKW
jgi:hypothetical protein